MVRSFNSLWKFQCGSSVISVGATPDCGLVAAGSVDRRVYLLDRDGHLLWPDCPTLDAEVWAVDISEDGGTVAAGTAEKRPAAGSLYLFDRSGDLLFQQELGSPVWSVSASVNGDVIAASTWANKVYVFKRSLDTYQQIEIIAGSGEGFYGTDISPNGDRIVVASYGKGLLNYRRSNKIARTLEVTAGLYNVQLFNRGRSAVVGRADGSLSVFRRLDGSSHRQSARIASRPICGVSVSDEGRLAACGSFDGRMYITTLEGDLLWQFETDGEVWTTAMSADGELVVAGSGDGYVYLLHNRCSDSALRELTAKERNVGRATGDRLSSRVSDLVAAYNRLGIPRYGSRRLIKLLTGRNSDGAYSAARKVLDDHLADEPSDAEAHFALAEILLSSAEWGRAIRHFQNAAEDPYLRTQSLLRAGHCFSQLGLQTAAQTTFRRARESYLNRDKRRVIYNLARSYEDQGNIPSAEGHYEVLLAWDIGYRGALNRIRDLQQADSSNDSDVGSSDRVDYTGLTVSLLGPDVPRSNEIDEPLRSVIRARSTTELSVPISERHQLFQAIDVIHQHLAGSLLSFYSLNYDVQRYVRYDYSPPHDELKKYLELTNLLAVVQDLERGAKTLDVGTATGRYPTLLGALGFDSFGVDNSEDSIAYAEEKRNRDNASATYLLGDATELPFENNQFRLLTCMMGTFAHFPALQRQQILTEFNRVLISDGVVVISTWDPECSDLSLLSMYSETEAERIRRASPSRHELQTLLRMGGFVTERVSPFCLLADSTAYELFLTPASENRQTGSIEWLTRAVEFDLAAKSMFSDMHGQMYLVAARKQQRS